MIGSPTVFPADSGKEGIVIMKKDKPYIVIDLPFDQKDINLPIRNLVAKYEGTGSMWIEEDSFEGKLQTGQKVRIWFNQVLESYPPIYRILKLEIL